jgi:DNA polymerase I-like protein with 3'-5' exonuclease and polymerase domains
MEDFRIDESEPGYTSPVYQDFHCRKCEQDVREFFQGFPDLRNWHRRAPREAEERGYVKCPDGRKVYFPTGLKPGIKANNYPVTAAESGAMRAALGRLERKLRREGYDATSSIFVYDEIVVRVKEDQAEEVHEIQKEIMRDEMQKVLPDVPAKASGGIKKEWGKV